MVVLSPAASTLTVGVSMLHGNDSGQSKVKSVLLNPAVLSQAKQNIIVEGQCLA